MTTEDQKLKIAALRKLRVKSATKEDREQLEAYLALPQRQRIEMIGHRAFIGADTDENWYGIGRLQYQFLVQAGLKAHHRFLDLACGSLRLGQFLIPYLDSGNYFGVDGEETLVEAGLKHELFFNLVETKRPRFAFNYDFDVSQGGHSTMRLRNPFSLISPAKTSTSVSRDWRRTRARARDSFSPTLRGSPRQINRKHNPTTDGFGNIPSKHCQTLARLADGRPLASVSGVIREAN